MDGSSAPTTGRWIDVDVDRYQVRLMSGTEATRTFAPVAVGAQVDSGAYESTQTGTFRVHNKIARPAVRRAVQDVHQRLGGLRRGARQRLPLAAQGRQRQRRRPGDGPCFERLHPRGRDSAAIFAYAEIGMVVYVHH